MLVAIDYRSGFHFPSSFGLESLSFQHNQRMADAGDGQNRVEIFSFALELFRDNQLECAILEWTRRAGRFRSGPTVK